MKNYIVIASMACVMSFTACNDDFMDRYPLDKQTESTAFVTNENFLTYNWKHYAKFRVTPDDVDLYDRRSDNATNQSSKNSFNVFAWDLITVPDASDDWDFSTIRSVNLMLDNIEGSSMTEAQKKHWRSVGYFFKSFDYLRLISLFGDVPWVEKTLTDADMNILYAKRTPRLEVAQKVLDMLLYAKENINTQSDGANTINLNCVNVLISRFGLFEGTWQKYHALSGKDVYNKYLEASLQASTDLMAKIPTIHTNYDELFNTDDLSKIPGVILYFRNIPVTGKGSMLTRYCRAANHWSHATADFVQSYLCNDGKPIWTSPLFEGDKETGDASIYQEFRNRDRRLYYTVCPPYKVVTPAANTADEKLMKYTDNPEDREFIDTMKLLSTPLLKQIPIRQWSGSIIRESPHFKTDRYNMGQTFVFTELGYFTYKYYNRYEVNGAAEYDNPSDFPIFRMGEVLVNHAEAAFELGKFDQGTADLTINKLRVRAHIPSMKVAEITGAFDPKRDADVDPVLWEIRRERRVELMAEGFRLNDIHRWKKGEYLNKAPLGVYIKISDLEDIRHVKDPSPSKLAYQLDRSGNAGRIKFYGDPNPGWQDKYYLSPLPINDLVMNKNLEQNPGYPRTNAK